MEKHVSLILEEQRMRALKILTDNRALVETLRNLLLEKKVLDKEALANILPATEKRDSVAVET